MNVKCVISMVVVVLAVVIGAGTALAGSVQARVVGSTGPVQAKLEPGEFTIPAGQKAVNLKYAWGDPGSGRQSTSLGKNIYNIDRGVYMVDAAGKPLMELPAGKYRFVVGGGPGANGSLSWNLAPAK